MTLEQKTGQFFFPAVFINDTEENIQATEKLIRELHIGGLTFFHSRASAATNYESKKPIVYNDNSYERLKALIIRYQKSASTPLLMSIDAEWGLAMRVEKTPQYPYAITLGALPETQAHLAYEVGKQIGLDLKSAGIHYNLAPLADINNNPNNPVIGYRSFGENKEKVARFALEYLKGLNEIGVLGCLKHFPGHGNTSVDSHLGLPILEQNLIELLDNELYPFIEGIKNNVDSIMIGHLAVPALNEGKSTSATLSKPIIEDLLRNQLQYKGLVISDALNMHSVSKLYATKGELEWEAFNAGNDVLCFAENVLEGIQAITKKASSERINASYNRIMACKKKVGLLDTKIITERSLDFETASQLNKKIAQSCITTIKDNNNYQLILEASSNEKLAVLSIYKSIENVFSTIITCTLPAQSFSLENGAAIENSDFIKKISTLDTIIIALFVPKAKPMQKFELEETVLETLKNLFETKKCILYLFGNPYALQVIPNLPLAEGIVQAYQDFDEFQEVAAQSLINNTKNKGSLPVTIKGI
ncbi:glycoside hydrolase family 3 protein [Flavobacterium sp. 7A]|uniref:glycoside hydrolase family 3 protein n=1 Tax=Flavobacterium sp. 7A TaxID=2940571 RepID=UPI0022267F34|nr:glycoside hydrolase family 3 N-terminal domain-containing protein [Flavobacterium sp. 7A]MCW2118526.1 beta-glucosidase-like glycosyl hydrolase [Flavobacterium sp. 7A]